MEEIWNDFKTAFPTKYEFIDNASLGDGHFGFVHRAKDIDRNVDVAIKIYHNGETPTGSERAWNLTAKTTHRQISQTHTVETFETSGKECKAVITRFVPGKSIKQIFEWHDTLEEKQQSLVAEDFAFTLLPSLLEIVSFCHSLNFGHGDLHEGNVIAFCSNITERHEFTATLIDFDNASFKPDLSANTEAEKISRDVRLLKRLSCYIVKGWEFENPVCKMIQDSHDVRDMKIGLQHVLKFVELIKKNNFTKENVVNILSSMIYESMNRFSPKSAIVAMTTIATTTGKNQLFARWLEEFKTQITSPENWRHEVTTEIIEHGAQKATLYKGFFG